MRRNYWGGDCYAHGLLALGQIDVIAECDMKLWDWAALVPVIEGAGGRVTDWQGSRCGRTATARVLSVGDPALLARDRSRVLNHSSVASGWTAGPRLRGYHRSKG